MSEHDFDEVIAGLRAKAQKRRRRTAAIEDWLATLTVAALSFATIASMFLVLWVLWSLGVWLQA